MTEIPSTSSQPEVFYFAETDRKWIARKWALVREYMQRADQEVNKWDRISGEINIYLDSHQITDSLQRARIRGESMALSDAFAAGNWFRSVAQAHMADVNLYLKMKEMGLH